MAATARILEERELQKRLARVDALVGELQQLSDPALRAMVEELLSTVLDLHGGALSRMLHALGPRGEPETDRLLERMAADDLIRGVLLLHGLHPIDLRTRVEDDRAKTLKKDVRGCSVTVLNGSRVKVIATATRELAAAQVDGSPVDPQGTTVVSPSAVIAGERRMELKWQDRFGLGGGDPMTLKEVGLRLGITREWVRKVEIRAIAKLGKDGEGEV